MKKDRREKKDTFFFAVTQRKLPNIVETANKPYTTFERRQPIRPITHETAPEIVSSQEYTNKCDIYSFAILGYEILTNNFDPFDGVENAELRVANDETFRPKKHLDRLSDDLQKLLSDCWAGKPAARPDFETILSRLSSASMMNSRIGSSDSSEESPGEVEVENEDTVIEFGIESVRDFVHRFVKVADGFTEDEPKARKFVKWAGKPSMSMDGDSFVKWVAAAEQGISEYDD